MVQGEIKRRAFGRRFALVLEIIGLTTIVAADSVQFYLIPAEIENWG